MKLQMDASASTVRTAALELMRRLTNEMLADEALASAVAQTAAEVERDGCFGEAEVLRVVAHNHRIRALDGQAQFAGLFAAYRHLQDWLDAGSDRPS
ncbi:hypothetical protein MKK69_22760 [Methylobacterium sp. J-026]|nr:hypothetical protein [Methylobacterium sp. J-026]